MPLRIVVETRVRVSMNKWYRYELEMMTCLALSPNEDVGPVPLASFVGGVRTILIITPSHPARSTPSSIHKK